MADFDPKSIPVLDDVIESEDADKLTSESTLTEDESSPSEDSLDLFAEKSEELPAETATSEDQTTEEISAEAEHETDIVDDVIDEDIESALEDIGSALIDYDTEKINTAIDAQPLKAEQIITEHPSSLKSVVDDVTKQLMPNLEQWLRFLIQQALEDRLPDEVIAKLSSNNDRTDDKK